MNIVILGAGAVGQVFGGFLANSGHQVTLLGRGDHITAVNERGLLIEGIRGNHLVTNMTGYTTVADMARQRNETYDLALVTVKSYDTDEVIAAFHHQFPDQIPMVSLQNGIVNLDRLIQVRGAAHALAGVVTFGAQNTAAGRVRIAVHADDVRIGGIDGVIDYGEVKRIAELFSAAGIQTQATGDIYRFLWGKMLYNCSLNGLAAILEVPYGELLDHESSRALIADLVGEVFQIIEREGQTVNWPDAESYLQALFERLLPLTAGHTPSMLQDLQRKKRTEIEALNGTIVTLAEKHGLDVPVNWLITKLIKLKEKSNGLRTTDITLQH